MAWRPQREAAVVRPAHRATPPTPPSLVRAWPNWSIYSKEAEGGAVPKQLDLEGRDEQRWFDLRGHGLHPSRPLLPHLDSPYGASRTAVTSDGCSIGDLDGGSAASKDAGPSTFAGNNSEGFAWLGPLPHLDTWRKRYRSFCRDGMRISVHDFIYIESVAGTESHVAYVEDLYEDGSENRMVRARWLEKPGDDHGVAMPPDVRDREVFFSYGLQDVGVSCVEGLALVLNYQHFEWFQSRAEEHSKWKPYLCYQKIMGTTVTPFDIAQLHGYAKQEILQALYRAPSSSMAVHFREPLELDLRLLIAWVD